jgi:hypothetical protein
MKCGACLALLAAAPSVQARAEEPAAPAGRPPVTFSLAVAAVVPSAGVDVSVEPARWLALGAQLTTLVVHWDLSLRARAFPLGGPGGPYLGAAAHLWYSPLVLSQATGGASAEVGWELRPPGGSVIGLGAGAGAFRQPAGSASPGSPASWEWLPMANLRIGRAR